MIFGSPLDEFEHWLQFLQLELYRGAERRYVVAIGRLCEVFALKVGKDKRNPDLERRMRLSMQWLDLHRQISNTPPAQPNPTARRAGKFRVIDGGRTQSGSTRR